MALMMPPIGTIYVVDPSPLNWLFVLFNTMEEPVRADHEGRIVPSLASRAQWLSPSTLRLKLRNGVFFHNGASYDSRNTLESFRELHRWDAPHPSGTWLNFAKGTQVEVIDKDTVHFHFPIPDGLALGKMRVSHQANSLFYRTIGFGYAKLGTAEGHW
jgi:ABC-type transport system substrate-binding protein